MWHWSKSGRDPEQQDIEAESRLEAAKQLAEQSRITTAKLRREVNKNGWTELLSQAMAARTEHGRN